MSAAPIPTVNFRCPFCGARASAGEMRTARAPNREPAVRHQLPACATFERLDATAYMRAVNARTKAPPS